MGTDTLTKISHDMGLLLFDADGDGDLDLYIASGGNEARSIHPLFRIIFISMMAKEILPNIANAIPINLTSKFCVRAADYDHDGDLDLFVSGRVDPGNYPRPVSSFIFRIDSKDGHVLFTDVTETGSTRPGKMWHGMRCRVY